MPATVVVGTTTATGSSDFFNSGDMAATPYVCGTSGTVDTMSIAIKASGFTTLALAIYDDAGSTPGVLLGQTNNITSGAAGTQSASMVSSVAVTSGVTYWLAMLPLGGSALNMTDTLGGSYVGASGQGSFPHTFPSIGFNDGSDGLPISGTDSTGGGGGGGGSTNKPLTLLGVG